MFTQFISNTRGTVAVFFAVSIIPVIVAVGSAADYTTASKAMTHLQKTVDAAALAGASSGSTESKERISAARIIFDANLPNEPYAAGLVPDISLRGDEVTVHISAKVPTDFLGIININEIPVSVTATAVTEGGPPTCLLALAPDQKDSIRINGSLAAIRAAECAVHANSSHYTAMYSNSGVDSTALLFCSVGGYEGSSFSPLPMENCPVIEDPFAGMNLPPVGGCEYNDFRLYKDTVILSPGVYCGGLTVSSLNDVTFNPGIYVIKDGYLSIGSGASVLGEGVLFYFYGAAAGMKIGAKANIDLSAPISGDYAGFLFLQHPDTSPGLFNKISGQAGVRLVGTLYFPTQNIVISSQGNFSINSPYMAIAANTFTFSGNGTMTINLDEDAAGYRQMAMTRMQVNSRLID